MRLASLLAASAAVLSLAAAPVQAQDYSLSPTYGGVGLTAGFAPDPYTVGVVAGGRTPASNVGSCAGWIASAPDFRLNYSAGGFPLTIFAVAGQDSTLVINAPNGRWYCDDDSGGNLNPSITWSSPMSGQYDIWVGTYAQGTNFSAQLGITELSR